MSQNTPERGRIEGGGDFRESEPQSPSRVSIVETLYFHTVGVNPHVVQTRYGRNLKTEEQVFVRRLTLTDDWVALDAGWLKAVSYVLIQNMEGRMLQVNPTDEERADIESRVVEISFSASEPQPANDGPRDMFSPPLPITGPIPTAHLILPPRESLRLCPLNIHNIRIRCRNKTAKIVLHMIPG